MTTAYIGRHRLHENLWKLQLLSRDYGDVYAEIEVPNDSQILSLADDFLYGIADAKNLEIKARRGNDE